MIIVSINWFSTKKKKELKWTYLGCLIMALVIELRTCTEVLYTKLLAQIGIHVPEKSE